MSILSKLKFWKKEDDDLGDLGLGKNDLGGDPFGGKDPFADDKAFPDMGGAAMQPQQQMRQAQQPAAPRQAQQQFGSDFGSGVTTTFGGQQPQQQRYSQAGYEPQPDFNRPFTIAAPPGQMQQQAGNFGSNSNYYSVSKDIEVISSKLDSLRSSLDIINQRLTNLERMAERDQMRKRTGW
jgi:hypothetical protein